MVVVKRQFITPGHLLDACGNVGERVRLTRKTRPGVSLSNAEEMEKIAPPFLRRSGV